MALSHLLADLGTLLRDRRRAAGFTQGELGDRAGFTGKYVSEIERGTRDVPVGTLFAIVHDGLGHTLDIRCEPNGRARAAIAAQRAIDELSRALGALPEVERKHALAIVRATLRLAQR